jgi:hypothetical protein
MRGRTAELTAAFAAGGTAVVAWAAVAVVVTTVVAAAIGRFGRATQRAVATGVIRGTATPAASPAVERIFAGVDAFAVAAGFARVAGQALGAATVVGITVQALAVYRFGAVQAFHSALLVFAGGQAVDRCRAGFAEGAAAFGTRVVFTHIAAKMKAQVTGVAAASGQALDRGAFHRRTVGIRKLVYVSVAVVVGSITQFRIGGGHGAFHVTRLGSQAIERRVEALQGGAGMHGIAGSVLVRIQEHVRPTVVAPAVVCAALVQGTGIAGSLGIAVEGRLGDRRDVHCHAIADIHAGSILAHLTWRTVDRIAGISIAVGLTAVR